jgi:hypothetical protein
LLWVGKFTIFNRYLFNTPNAGAEPADPGSGDAGSGSGGVAADELSAV